MWPVHLQSGSLERSTSPAPATPLVTPTSVSSGSPRAVRSIPALAPAVSLKQSISAVAILDFPWPCSRTERLSSLATRRREQIPTTSQLRGSKGTIHQWRVVAMGLGQKERGGGHRPPGGKRAGKRS